MRWRLWTCVFVAMISWGHCSWGICFAEPLGDPSELSLDRLKKLEGEWFRTDENGKATDQLITSVRVTAGGNAVVETVYPGTKHEMVTVYHQDGPDLVLTHFCVVGNHPRMKAEAGRGQEKLVFKCIGGFDMKEDDKHMHQGTIVWIDENHIHSEWLMFEKGKNIYTASHQLVRKVAPRVKDSG